MILAILLIHLQNSCVLNLRVLACTIGTQTTLAASASRDSSDQRAMLAPARAAGSQTPRPPREATCRPTSRSARALRLAWGAGSEQRAARALAWGALDLRWPRRWHARRGDRRGGHGRRRLGAGAATAAAATTAAARAAAAAATARTAAAAAGRRRGGRGSTAAAGAGGAAGAGARSRARARARTHGAPVPRRDGDAPQLLQVGRQVTERGELLAGVAATPGARR